MDILHARDQLHLIHPRRFYTTGQPRAGDRYVTAPRSRFIPPALLRHFDTGIAEAAADGPTAVIQRGSLPTVNIAGQMRAMWG